MSSNKFGLGRGLADLQMAKGAIPDISVLTGAERVVVKQIPLAQIGANPDQPRKVFNEDELNDLAASIREKGVLQPILLRTVTGRPYMYEIVAGERRYRASKLAGLNEIPALVKTLSNENAMEIALIENVQRENLNPIEEANAYQNLMTECGYEISDVVRLIGKSESYIRNCMRITALPDSVKEMVEQGQISASHARTIAVAKNPEEIAYKIIGKKMSVADTQRMVNNAKKTGKYREKISRTIDPKIVRDMEKQIEKSIGAPVKILEKRGGAGQIVISFASRIQLNELIEKIS